MVLAPLLFALFVGVAHSLPEDNLSTPELCKYWGYPVEVHDAVTKDGYVLALHRIPHGRKNGKVFIQSVFRSLLILICYVAFFLFLYVFVSFLCSLFICPLASVG